MKVIMFLMLMGLSYLLLAHGTEVHEEKKPDIKPKIENKESVTPKEKKKVDQRKYTLGVINDAYIKTVKPIFEAKCFDCHSQSTTYPWYYKIPGVKQMIDHDIKEAKSHIDMSRNFPFISHDTPINDLKSIKKSVLNGHMPPLRYVIMHWDSKVTEEEKETIRVWSDNGIKALEK